jgi:hypothetical protein
VGGVGLANPLVVVTLISVVAIFLGVWHLTGRVLVIRLPDAARARNPGPLAVADPVSGNWVVVVGLTGVVVLLALIGTVSGVTVFSRISITDLFGT